MTRHPSVAVITGSASGIGRHLADIFINKGYCVLATDINVAALKETASGR